MTFLEFLGSRSGKEFAIGFMASWWLAMMACFKLIDLLAQYEEEFSINTRSIELIMASFIPIANIAILVHLILCYIYRRLKYGKLSSDAADS